MATTGTGGDTLLERELSEARAREADYRARLERHRSLARELRAHAAALREAVRGARGGPDHLTRLLASVAQRSSQALGTPRTSIWLFDDDRTHLVCRLHLPPDPTPEAEPPRIAAVDAPLYIEALTRPELGAIAVRDVWTDPRTAELGDYLRAHDVGALLDIPIVGAGVTYGVVCHEWQGGKREWQEEEIDFAADVAAMVALALEGDRRSEAERAVRGSEAKYQQLVEALPVTVYSFEARTGELEYLSPRIRALGGWGPEEYLVAGGIERWVAAIESDDRALVRRRLSGSIDQGFEEEIVYRIRLPDGRTRWVRDTCAVVRDVHGKPVAVQGTLADVTALKEAELARVEIERRYRTLLENVDMLAIILDPEGRVEFVNDCFARFTGFRPEEARGADAFDLILPEADRETVRVDFKKSMRRGLLAPRFETNVRTRDGRIRRILWTNTLQRTSDGTSSGAVVGSSSLGVDITERLAAEAAQLEGQKLESLGRLAATVAHDFNNLLTVIGAASSALCEAAPAHEREKREIEGAVMQAAGLTRSLLAYARREDIAPELLSVDEEVRQLLPMLATLVGPELSFSSALGAGRARVVVDGTQLRQVVLNLVSNARDATVGVGHEVRLTSGLVTLEGDQARAQGLIAEGTFLVLSVADDGRGMTRELVDRAFDPFFTTKGRGRGTGLGLAMCASIIRRAGGFIAVDSAPGRGSTFRAHLPVARLAPETTTASAPAARRRPPTGPSILVVEDNEAIRNIVSRLLVEEGLDVLEASDLASARRQLAERPVDLLLTDGVLPDGDGRDLAEEVLREGRAHRVVFMSGSPISDGPAVDAVIPKPFRAELLIATVLAVLGRPSGHPQPPLPAGG